MPSPEKKTRRRTSAGSIYAIGAADSPYVKIGSTRTSVEKRLQSLQTGQPAKLHIVATQSVATDLHRIERQIHAFLAAERHHGEWFALKLDANELTALIHRAVDYLTEHHQHMLQERHGPRKPRATHDAGMALRAQCAKAGMTLTNLATLADMRLSALSKVEHGYRQLTLREGIRIAKILGCQTHDLAMPLAKDPLTSQEKTHASRHSEPPPPPPATQLTWEW